MRLEEMDNENMGRIVKISHIKSKTCRLSKNGSKDHSQIEIFEICGLISLKKTEKDALPKDTK